MRGSTLVTGGSDGSVRVWSLVSFSPIHRLAAHDNSVTSLQFDDARIVSGGSDGRVKIWDTEKGLLVRELSQPAEAVWRVAFESERCVVMASRGGRTIMEVWDFAPVGEEPDGAIEGREHDGGMGEEDGDGDGDGDEEGEDEAEGEEDEEVIIRPPDPADATDLEMLDVASDAGAEAVTVEAHMRHAYSTDDDDDDGEEEEAKSEVMTD